MPDAPSPDFEDRPLPTPAELKAKITEHTARVEEAAERRRKVLGLVRGAKLRVGLLEAETEGQGIEALVANLGLGVSAYMLMEIVNGNVVVKDAKMAADVAKIGLELHRALSVDEASDRANLTPAERDERRKTIVASIKTLHDDLQKRAAAATDITEAEVDAVPAVAPSPPPRAKLGIVAAKTPPVQAQEA
jgi:hypothetical protein